MDYDYGLYHGAECIDLVLVATHPKAFNKQVNMKKHIYFFLS